MTWAIPEHQPEEVNRAARILSQTSFPVTTDDGQRALIIINNWRSSHAYPLNTFQITLRRRARKIQKGVIIAQREKRLDSIHRKLVAKPTMRLTQMQDIADCRAVFSRLRHVYQLVQTYKTGYFEHKRRNEKDYIQDPKSDGYRSFHLVYEFIGTKRTHLYNGLRVEIQIRTQYQHEWATAVEAAGIFTRQALKSNQGDSDWLRFFALVSTAIAAIEKTPCVPNTPSNRAEPIKELRELATKLRAREMLRAYSTTLDIIGSAKDGKYFIVTLDPDEKHVMLYRFKASESEIANHRYTEFESKIPDNSRRQVVLVSVGDINALKRAYPNYFLDTALFARLVDRILAGKFPDPRPHQPTLPGL